MKPHVIGRYCSVVAAVAVGCASLMMFPGGSRAQNKGAEKPDPQPGKKVYVIPEGPWAKVLEWLREETELPIIGQLKPTGNFRYPAVYEPPYREGATLGDVIDILNVALLDQKLMIIRREAAILIWPADEALSESPRYVAIEDLPKRAKTEYLRVNFQLRTFNAEKIAPMVKALMSPFGQVIPLEEANQLILMDDAANLRSVVRKLSDAEAGTLPSNGRPASWKETLDWLSERTKLPFLGKVMPTVPAARRLTAGDIFESTEEIVDSLNDELREQKLLIIRGEKAIYVVWTDEAIDPALVPHVRWADLAERGKTEVVSINVAVKGIKSDEVMASVKPLLSPLGSVRALPENQLVVQDTAGNLRVVLDALRKISAKTTK